MWLCKNNYITGGATQNKRQGFTYVELLMAITIFSIVVAGLFGLFTAAFKAQASNLEKIELLNSASYLTEYMSRALRMAKKDVDGRCLNIAKNNYETTGSSIYFLGYDNTCQRFFLDASDDLIKVQKSKIGDPPTKSNLQTAIELMPGANLKAEILIFNAQGDGQTGEALYFQPNVTFVLKLKTKLSNAEEMHFQTSITKRELDIQN